MHLFYRVSENVLSSGLGRNQLLIIPPFPLLVFLYARVLASTVSVSSAAGAVCHLALEEMRLLEYTRISTPSK